MLFFVCTAMSSNSSAQTITPSPGWADSYSVNGKCYCATTFDHGIGNYTVDTPAGVKTVRQVCAAIGPGPGKSNNPVYNTVQCGHEPAHDDAINIGGRPVKDEKVCPGRVDQGSSGCQIKGPLWDLSVFDDGDPQPHAIPGTIEAEDYSSQSGTQTLDSSDSGGGLVVGYIENGDYLEFDVDVAANATFRIEFRIASATGGSSIVVSANGSAVGSVEVPNTGGWRTWQTISTQLNLTTSQDRLRLTFSGGSGYLVDVNRLDVITVNDPVDPVELSVNDQTVDESDGAAAVVISLSRASTTEVSVLAFTRTDGSARGGEDFYGLTRTIRIPAGATSAALPVTIIKDTVRESAETFSVRLINPVGADIDDGIATVTITDDAEVPPSFSIDSATVNEAAGEATLTVTLSAAVDASVTVFTRAGTAAGGSDYYGFTKTLDFSGGTTVATVLLSVLNDTVAEATETLTVRLVSATGAAISEAIGTVIINDDD